MALRIVALAAKARGVRRARDRAGTQQVGGSGGFPGTLPLAVYRGLAGGGSRGGSGGTHQAVEVAMAPAETHRRGLHLRARREMEGRMGGKGQATGLGQRLSSVPMQSGGERRHAWRQGCRASEVAFSNDSAIFRGRFCPEETPVEHAVAEMHGNAVGLLTEVG